MKNSQSCGSGKSSSTKTDERMSVGQPATPERNPDAAETLSARQGKGQIAPVAPTEPSDDELPFRTRLLEALRTADSVTALRILGQVAKTTPASDQQSQLNCALTTLLGIHPKDQLEALLAVQMLGVHNLAMQFMGCATKNQTVAVMDRSVNWVIRLSRTFVDQMEALNRYRGKGQQKVVVEYLHVHQGGQAIVGAFTQNKQADGGEEGGGNAER